MGNEGKVTGNWTKAINSVRIILQSLWPLSVSQKGKRQKGEGYEEKAEAPVSKQGYFNDCDGGLQRFFDPDAYHGLVPDKGVPV